MTPISELLARLRSEAQRLRDTLGGDTPGGNPAHRALMLQLARPNLGPTPQALRRILEPLVATAAALALVTLVGFGVASFTMFLLAGALIYTILTRVFGLELDFQVPLNNM